VYHLLNTSDYNFPFLNSYFETRKMYRTLLDEDENFTGFDIQHRFIFFILFV